MRATDTPSTSASVRALTFASYISFIPIGVATVILGPMLPALSARWSLNYSQAGALFPVQYVASTCAVGLSGVLAARRGFRFPMKTGIALMSVGLALLLANSKPIAMLGIAANGAGLGLAVPAANLLVAAANPSRRSATLNLLNFFWSTGAVACPFLVAAAVNSQHVFLFLIGLSAFSLLVATSIALMGPYVVEPLAAPDNTTSLLPLMRTRKSLFLIFSVLFFLYVGVENGFGQWMATYVKSLGTLTLAVALMTPSVFYASLMLGRVVAPALLRAINEVVLVRIGLFLSCLGMAGLMFSRQWTGVALSVLVAGLGLSFVYPIMIALLSKEFPSTRVGSVMFVLSNIGGGLLPWMVGISSTRFGTLRVGLIVPLLGCAMMLAVFLGDWTPAPARPSHSLLGDSGGQPGNPYQSIQGK